MKIYLYSIQFHYYLCVQFLKGTSLFMYILQFFFNYTNYNFFFDSFKSTSRFSNSVSEVLKNSAAQNKNELVSVLSLGDDTLTESKTNGAVKIAITSNQNLLKNVMHDNGNLESFDVLTVTFPENVRHGNPNTKCDSMILAPDSLDASLETSKANSRKFHKTKTLANSNQGENAKSEERNSEKKTSGKRLSSEISNDSRVKRHNDGSQVESGDKMAYKTDAEVPDPPEIIISKNISSIPKRGDSKIKTASKDLSVQSDYRTKRQNTDNQTESEFKFTKPTASGCLVPEIVVSSDVPKVSKHIETKTKAISSDLNAQNTKKKTSASEIDSKNNIIDTPKSSVSNSVVDFKKKVSPYQVSPSLLPTNVNALPKIIDLNSSSNDNDDFQDLVPSTKSVQAEDSWEICDKKKSLRRNKTVKSVKSTSKFKMTLVAPPLNYKKPNYKQTKLSKSIFKAKEANSHPKSPEELVSRNCPDDDDHNDIVLSEDDSIPTFLPQHCQTSTQCILPKSLGTFDIDATFIPENFRMESPDCATSNVKKQPAEKSHFKNGGLFSNISFPEEVIAAPKVTCENEKGKFKTLMFLERLVKPMCKMIKKTIAIAF